MLHGVALSAIRFGRLEASRGPVGTMMDLVERARRLLTERLQQEYVKAWICGRRAVFVDSWVYRSSLCTLDSRRHLPFDLVIRVR